MSEDSSIADFVPLDTLQKEADKLDRFWMICMLQSGGIHLFLRTLELTYFDPNIQTLNDQFQLAVAKWPSDLLIAWFVATVPIRYRGICERLAHKIGFKITAGNIPVVIGGGKVQEFPLHGPNVVLLEGLIEAGLAPAHRAKEYGEIKKVEFQWQMGKLEGEQVPPS